MPTSAAGNASGTDATLAGASATDVDADATGIRSDLFGEPVSFQGRSLEGMPRADDPKELAQALEGAELPVEELPSVDLDPAEDAYRDEDDRLIRMRREWAEHGKNRRDRGDNTADGVWSGDHGRRAAIREANARWSELAAAERTSSTTFGDGSRQLLHHVERDHTAHHVPRPRGRDMTRVAGFGRLSHAWNEFPFSPRERIVNALHRGEALCPDRIVSLELGLEGNRGAGSELSSSRYRAMVDMIADLGDRYRHSRWSLHGDGGERLLRLIDMLDHAGVVD